jgi:hypothetical protein
MPQVRITGKRLAVGDDSRALISGEVHYWRLAPPRWRDVLRCVRDMGLDVISTYVCWDYHEIAPDRFDFRGETEPARNLIRFLEMVAEEGFWLLYRPGPYIYSEWVNMGVPDRAARYHRLHPEFLRMAEPYMAAAVEVARPFFATNGGPIVLFQADNEPDPWVYFYATQQGAGETPGPYQDWLRERYGGDLAVLNAAWEADYSDFAEARAVTRPAIETRGYLNRYLDFRRFIYWYTTEIGRRATDTYRALGVDVPIYINHYAGHPTQDWRALERVSDLAGPDFYSHNEFRREDGTEHQEFLHLARYARTYSVLPFIPEFEAGIWHGWHTITGILTPRHYLLASLSALLAGMAGWNWYMLVNRDNWYMSPINEWGRPHPELYAVFAQIVRLFRAIDPPSLEKLTDTAIALDILDRSSEIGGFRDPTRDACYAADIDYECYDVAAGSIEKPLMFYSGGRWMAPESQTRLAQYVESGGTLVCFQNLPVLDDAYRPHNGLALREPDGIRGEGPLTISLGAGMEPVTVTVTPGAWFTYRYVPGEPITAERIALPGTYQSEETIHQNLPVGERYTIGYRERRGKGSLIVLGVPPDPALVAAVHRWLNVPVYSRARAAGISTAVFRRGEALYLIAVNAGDCDQDAVIDLWPALFEDVDYAVYDLLNESETPAARLNLRRAGSISLRLAARSGTAARIARA